MTPKQTLLAHIRELHPVADAYSHTGGPKSGSGKLERRTLVQLQYLHGSLHHRMSPNHYHEGVNLGPGARPPGWKTGENAVLKSKRRYI